VTEQTAIAEPPRWRVHRWLVDPGSEAPLEVRRELLATLFGSSAALTGASINSAAVASVIAAKLPTTPFLIWAGLQIVFAVARVLVQIRGGSTIKSGAAADTDAYILVSLLWAATVGYGGFISVASGDWVVATLACVSGAAMAGGICFRHFGAPRLVAAMISLSFGPCALGAVLSGEQVMLLAGFQLPLYLFSMAVASFQMNKMMIRTMRAERLNDYRARHDELTGCLNRTGFSRALEGVLNGRRANEACFALLYIDLNGFKSVNDAFGHAAGDDVLTQVAERLRGVIRTGDEVARLGGDEFVIIALGADEAAAVHVGQRVLDAMSGNPFVCGGEAAIIGAGVGIALCPAHGQTAEDLLAAADKALYEAKKSQEPCSMIAPKRVAQELRLVEMQRASAPLSVQGSPPSSSAAAL
jgi:diguanylate cyclase (GGDEF)-like protein